MSHTQPRLPRLLLWPLLLAWLIALPALGASLKPEKTEIAVDEEVVVSITGKPFIAIVTDWSAGEGLQLLDSDSDRLKYGLASNKVQFGYSASTVCGEVFYSSQVARTP